MFYTVYKTTCLLNGKFYIGKHQTKNIDDGYLGSGKYLKAAIAKHGKENFKKEILHVFDTEEEMNVKEKELVIICEQSYNLCEGGKGGFGYINRNGLVDRKSRYENGIGRSLTLEDRQVLGRKSLEKLHAKMSADSEYKRQVFEKQKKTRQERYGMWKVPSFAGKQHSQETKARIGRANSNNKGPKNASFGTYWITDGISNMKLKPNQPIPEGWHRGRNSVYRRSIKCT